MNTSMLDILVASITSKVFTEFDPEAKCYNIVMNNVVIGVRHSAWTAACAHEMVIAELREGVKRAVAAAERAQ